MTVKRLLIELLKCPLDAEVLVSAQGEDGDYRFLTDLIVVDYRDGSIGLAGNICNDMTGKK